MGRVWWEETKRSLLGGDPAHSGQSRVFVDSIDARLPDDQVNGWFVAMQQRAKALAPTEIAETQPR